MRTSVFSSPATASQLARVQPTQWPTPDPPAPACPLDTALMTAKEDTIYRGGNKPSATQASVDHLTGDLRTFAKSRFPLPTAAHEGERGLMRMIDGRPELGLVDGSISVHSLSVLLSTQYTGFPSVVHNTLKELLRDGMLRHPQQETIDNIQKGVDCWLGQIPEGDRVSYCFRKIEGVVMCQAGQDAFKVHDLHWVEGGFYCPRGAWCIMSSWYVVCETHAREIRGENWPLTNIQPIHFGKERIPTPDQVSTVTFKMANKCRNMMGGFLFSQFRLFQTTDTLDIFPVCGL